MVCSERTMALGLPSRRPGLAWGEQAEIPRAHMARKLSLYLSFALSGMVRAHDIPSGGWVTC